jgi:drug/metabolite transporter (DMT)-like permease
VVINRGGQNTRKGYTFAVAAAAISGVSVFVNSLGVRSFTDPVLYTALKDGLVGLLLLVPLCCSSTWRAEYRQLDPRTWAWLIALALTGGSVPFALFYSGLQVTTAATGALVNHFQFALVAVFAVTFLHERLRPAVWAGLAVLLVATILGTNLEALQWNAGAALIAVSTVLFAIDFVIAKYLLRNLATLTVMTARMTLGTALLFVYVTAEGRLAPVAALNSTQWTFVVVTGLLLLCFTVTTFSAIRHASVSAVLAIGAAAPIITTLLQAATTGKLQLAPADAIGLLLTLLAVGAIIVIGVRQDTTVRVSDSRSPGYAE